MFEFQGTYPMINPKKFIRSALLYSLTDLAKIHPTKPLTRPSKSPPADPLHQFPSVDIL
jgi:hypothetical protein